MADTETQLATFYARYEPALAELAKEIRAKLRLRLGGLNELVYLYERQKAFVIAYSPGENGAAGVCGVSLKPDGVSLFLNGGDALSKSDPKRLLGGSGKMARQLVLGSIAEFDSPEVDTLIAAALKLAKVRPDPTAKATTIIKTGEQRARAQRAAKRPAPAAGSQKKTRAKR